jgi:hypothetical protein
MGMKKKTIVMIAGLTVLAAALAAILSLRYARRDTVLLELLPPDLDLYAVADIGSLKTNPALGKLLSDPANFPHDEDYDRFIRATGFRYESDLKQIAAGKFGTDWVGAARVTIDRARVVPYLESQGAEKKAIEGKTVYSFGRLRPFQLVFLDEASKSAAQETNGTLIAFTIGGDDSRIRQAIERHNRDLRDSAASELGRRNDLAHIRRESGTWIIARPERLGMASGAEAQVGSLNLNASLLRGSQTIYVTLDATPARINLQVEDYCDSPASAQRIAGSLQGLLALVKAMPAGKAGAPPGGSAQPPSAQSILDGIAVEQSGPSVFLRWQPGEEVLRLLESNPR